MNRTESEADKLERQQRAVADLRLEQEADEDAQKAVVEQAANRAINDHWPEMPEAYRQHVVAGGSGFEALTFQLAIFRRGWSTGANAERIRLDPDIAGPRILVRAYATAEADTLRMRREAGVDSTGDEQRPSLEDRLRRYLPRNE